ncbi:MAG: hypothetical protein R3F29_07055 [Planctomycetota bacterium]
MLSRLLLPAVLVVAACSTPGDTADDTAATTAPQEASSPIDAQNPLAYDDADCNLSTPLQPGVPGSPGHLIASPRNPNGDSELAVMMRQFIDDLTEARIQAQGGGQVKPMFATHRMMRCAWPTNPSERDQGYDMRAQAYLFAVRQFDAAPSQMSYNAIVANCIACHQASCNSVVPLIEKLKW